MDLYDVQTWLFDAWSKAIETDSGWRGYVRARGTTGRVLATAELPGELSQDAATAAAEAVARDGVRSVELVRRGRTTPADRYQVEAASVPDAASTFASAHQALIEQLVKLVDRTVRANEELTRALVAESRMAAEIEGYAHGRQSAPEMREAVSIAANAFASRFTASQSPTAILQALLSDPVKARAAWTALPDEERAKYATALMAIVS